MDSITIADIELLKNAGFYTVESVAYSPKNKLAADLLF